MAGVELHQVNHASPRLIPRQPHNYAIQNPGALPAADNGQLEGQWENIPPPVGGVPVPGRMEDPHRIDMAYHGMVDYRPQPIGDSAVQYIFPDVGHGQGIPAQAPPNAPENREYALFPYPPPYLAPDPARVAFPHLFVNQVPAPDQPGAERLRRLAGRYLNQLDSQVGRLCMEPVAAGRFKVVIELETSDVLF